MEVKTCAACGAEVPAGAGACPKCGARLSSGTPGALTVQVTVGYLTGPQTFDEDVVTIGRPDPDRGSHPDVDLSGDDAVSRFHAELRRRADGYYLVDLGSTNGTRLRGEEVPALSECKLESGDEIGIGERTTLRVEF